MIQARLEVFPLLYPLDFFFCKFVCFIAGIHYVDSFQEYYFTSIFRKRLVLFSFLNNKHFIFIKLYRFIPKVYSHLSFMNNKYFITICMCMPRKMTFNFYYFYQIVIQLSYTFGRPIVIKQGKFFNKIYCH